MNRRAPAGGGRRIRILMFELPEGCSSVKRRRFVQVPGKHRSIFDSGTNEEEMVMAQGHGRARSSFL